MCILKILMPQGQPLPFIELLNHPYTVNHICLLHLHFYYLCHSVYICTVSDQQAVTRHCALDVTPSCTIRQVGTPHQHNHSLKPARSWMLFVLTSARLLTLINVYKYLKRGVKNTEPDYCQWCPVTGEEAIGTNGKTEKSI